MRPQKCETRPREGAGRASELFRFATNAREDTSTPLSLQLFYLARRLGAVDPATLSTLAALAFGGRAS